MGDTDPTPSEPDRRTAAGRRRNRPKTPREAVCPDCGAGPMMRHHLAQHLAAERGISLAAARHVLGATDDAPVPQPNPESPRDDAPRKFDPWSWLGR